MSQKHPAPTESFAMLEYHSIQTESNREGSDRSIPGEKYDLLNHLIQMIRNGACDKLKELLNNLSPEEGARILNKVHECGGASLHFAARLDRIHICELLLQKGAYVNIIGLCDMTPLHLAAIYGCNRLSENSGDPWSYGSIQACQPVISQLIASGALVNKQDCHGQTALHYAARVGNSFTTSELLKSNEIDTEVSDKRGMTPLHYAARFNNPEVVKILLNATANSDALDENECTALHWAAIKGNKDIELFYLQSLEKGKDAKKIEYFQYYREKNSKVSSILYPPVSANHLERLKVPLKKAAASGYTEIVKCLLEHGAEINCRDQWGDTPLHKAAHVDAEDIVDILLKNGSDIEKSNDVAFTPLWTAVASGHTSIVEKLLKAGANMEFSDEYGRKAIHLAMDYCNPDVFQILLEYGSHHGLKNEIHLGLDHDFQNKPENTPLNSAAHLGQEDSVINAADASGNTPLHYAVLRDQCHLISMLINSGAKINARDIYLRTPLFVAVQNSCIKCCQILLDFNCEVDAVDSEQRTPLHMAVRYCDIDIVKLLLKYKANITKRDSNGENCLDAAFYEPQEKIFMELLSKSNYREALRNVTKKNQYNNLKTEFYYSTPLRKLIRHMPSIAKHVFDKSVACTEYETIYNFEFLDDTFTCYESEPSTEQEEDDSSTDFINDRHRRRNLLPYTDDKEMLKSNHPLMLMVRYGREDLLCHPLCKTLVDHKWRKYGRYYYFKNLFVFAVFIVLLSSYIITSIPPCSDEKTHPQCCSLRNYTCQPYVGECNKNINEHAQRKDRGFIYFLIGFLLLMQAYQFFRSGRRYINRQHVLQFFCVISAIIFVTDFTECSTETGIRQVWQWQLGSLSVFSGWLVLIMFMRKFPYLGLYITMFTRISETFLKFSLVFFLFIAAFAIALFAVLQNQDPFRSPGESILKTSIMMIGEIEFDSIFHDPKQEVFFKGPAYFFVVCFVFVMAVILMNMLVGLAIADIKEVQEKATLERLAQKIELILGVESIVPMFLLRTFVSRSLTVVHEQPSMYWKFLYFISRLLSLKCLRLRLHRWWKIENPYEDDKVKENKIRMQSELQQHSSHSPEKDLHKQLEGIQNSVHLIEKDLQKQREDIKDSIHLFEKDLQKQREYIQDSIHLLEKDLKGQYKCMQDSFLLLQKDLKTVFLRKDVKDAQTIT